MAKIAIRMAGILTSEYNEDGSKTSDFTVEIPGIKTPIYIGIRFMVWWPDSHHYDSNETRYTLFPGGLVQKQMTFTSKEAMYEEVYKILRSEGWVIEEEQPALDFQV